jgi:hypothetical protein
VVLLSVLRVGDEKQGKADGGGEGRVRLALEFPSTAALGLERRLRRVSGRLRVCSVGASPRRGLPRKRGVVSGWQHKARLLGATVYRPEALRSGPGKEFGWQGMDELTYGPF